MQQCKHIMHTFGIEMGGRTPETLQKYRTKAYQDTSTNLYSGIPTRILEKSEQKQQQHKLQAKLRFCTPQDKKPKLTGSSIREANTKRKSIPEPTALA